MVDISNSEYNGYWTSKGFRKAGRLSDIDAEGDARRWFMLGTASRSKLALTVTQYIDEKDPTAEYDPLVAEGGNHSSSPEYTEPHILGKASYTGD